MRMMHGAWGVCGAGCRVHAQMHAAGRTNEEYEQHGRRHDFQQLLHRGLFIGGWLHGHRFPGGGGAVGVVAEVADDVQSAEAGGVDEREEGEGEEGNKGAVVAQADRVARPGAEVVKLHDDDVEDAAVVRPGGAVVVVHIVVADGDGTAADGHLPSAAQQQCLSRCHRVGSGQLSHMIRPLSHQGSDRELHATVLSLVLRSGMCGYMM